MVSGPKSSKMVSAVSLPIAASQLIELSKRDAVVDSVHLRAEEAVHWYRAGLPAGVDRGESLSHRWREVAIAHTTASVEEELVVRRH